MNRDRVPIYEVYDDEGELICSGLSKEIAEEMGIKSPAYVTKACNMGTKLNGYSVVKAATIRKVFDCYHKGKFVCCGTYDEIAECTGFNREYVKAASYAATHKRAAKTRESMMLLLFEHDNTRVEWIK